jgi:CrcB protein
VDSIRAVAAVAAGGAVGALGRYAISEAGADLGIASPWATLVVNVSGCFLMGLLVAAILADPSRHPLWRPLLGIGALGGFTTFSAFAGDAVILADEGAWLAAVGYVAVTLVGGLLALRAGVATGEMRRALRGEP